MLIILFYFLLIALLYRCQSAQITNIWGCNDNEKLTEVKNLDLILSFKLWVIDIPHIHTLHLNFHDYDNIEVWGM